MSIHVWELLMPFSYALIMLDREGKNESRVYDVTAHTLQVPYAPA